MSKKRTIDAFFGTDPNKKQRVRVSTLLDEASSSSTPTPTSEHPTYPFPIPELPSSITKELASLPARAGKAINDQPDLDLLYFEPYIPTYLAKDLFHFLRSQLPFYRVKYTIKRGGIETQINTPRFTTVFGLDATSRFDPSDPSSGSLVDASTGAPVPASTYARYAPRPIPQCLDVLHKSVEAATKSEKCDGGCTFNFCLVNYYASGADSISFHSDDERFLGPEPAIASFSLGARRDFLMKHKPVAPPTAGPETQVFKQLKLPLGSGDMVLMRGRTQANWLHSIPKRTGKNEADGGRINITFRKALVKGGTDNYYNYNVGTGPVYRWDADAKEMKLWKT